MVKAILLSKVTKLCFFVATGNLRKILNSYSFLFFFLPYGNFCKGPANN